MTAGFSIRLACGVRKGAVLGRCREIASGDFGAICNSKLDSTSASSSSSEDVIIISDVCLRLRSMSFEPVDVGYCIEGVDFGGVEGEVGTLADAGDNGTMGY